jgi:hypothetical protein
MGGRKIVLVSTAGFSVLYTVIFWWEAKTKRLFSQCWKDIVGKKVSKLRSIGELRVFYGITL